MEAVINYIIGSPSAVTYNGNPSFSTIGKAHLDYYGGVTRQTSEEEIERLAQECIELDLRLALVTFFQKRDCRGGSGERKSFIVSMSKVPGDLRRKLYSLIPEYGYWKDLNKLARVIPADQDFIAELFATQLYSNIVKFVGIDTDLNIESNRNLEKWIATESQQDDKSWHAVSKIIKSFNSHLIIPITLRNNVVNKVIDDLKSCLAKISKEFVVDYKVGGDLKIKIKDDEKVQILINRYNHVLNKASNLPIKLMELKRTGYRKWCSFARGYYEIVEHFKSTDDWSLINYSTVPSIAFDRTKKEFAKHDQERFHQFIESVKKGETKINVGRLMPFELVAQPSSEVRDEQWKQVVKETHEFYANVNKDNIFYPENGIHIADVSGSMTSGGTPKPIDVSLSLAFLMSEVSGRPMYTFSGEPKKYSPIWTSLTEAQQMVNDENYNTNFRKLIDRIYDDCMIEADQKEVAPSEVIPGSIYIYTDGGFDQMCSEKPTTAIDYIKNKFDKFKKIPVIIFWNVAGNVKDFAVNTDYTGVVQLAGFSKDVYQIFTRLTSVEDISPEGFFRKAVLNERYQPILKVYDECI